MGDGLALNLPRAASIISRVGHQGAPRPSLSEAKRGIRPKSRRDAISQTEVQGLVRSMPLVNGPSHASCFLADGQLPCQGSDGMLAQWSAHGRQDR